MIVMPVTEPFVTCPLEEAVAFVGMVLQSLTEAEVDAATSKIGAALFAHPGPDQYSQAEQFGQFLQKFGDDTGTTRASEGFQSFSGDGYPPGVFVEDWLIRKVAAWAYVGIMDTQLGIDSND